MIAPNCFKTSCLALLIAFNVISLSAFAQTDSLPDYPVDTIKGQLMYRYTVEKGEGLYRVSKKLGISQDQIIKYNPSIAADGLKLGQNIHVPVVLVDAARPKSDTAQYVYHVIQPKETLYSLSKRYGVSAKDIERLNPDLVPKLPYGRTLRLPRTAQSLKVQTQIAKSESQAEPQIEKQPEKKAEQPVATVLPDTTPRQPAELVSVKTPQFLETPYIPADSQRVDFSYPQYRQDTDTVFSPTPLLIGDGFPTDFLHLNDSGELIPMRVAYLLPLMLDASKRDANMDRFLEFYEGSLLAINDLQRQGLRFEVYTYDIEKNDISLQAVLQSPELKTIDAIIGPAYPAQVEMVSQFVKQERIPAVVPFTPNINSIDTNNYLLRFNLTVEQEAEILAQYFVERKSDAQVVLVDSEYGEESDASKYIIEQMKKNRVQISNVKIGNLKNVLKQNKENVLIFKSMKIQDIQNYFEEISSLTWDYQISLVGQYGWGKTRIPLKMYYASVFDADNTLKEDLYAEQFNKFYNYPLSNTRPRYDMLGYDITVYTVRMLYESQLNNADNRTLEQIIPSIDFRGIQSDIHFSAVSPQGGYVNSGRVAVRPADR